MNRSLLYGFLAGFVLAVVAAVVLARARSAPPASPSAERAAAAGPTADGPAPSRPPPVGRYQLVSSIEILMLDTATGELWFYRRGRWHRAADAPQDDGAAGAVLGELEERGREPASDAAAPAQPAAAQERGRAEVIQVESAPERPEKPAKAERKPARGR